MEGRFPVFLGGETVGSVEVRPEGLYHSFRCRCKVSAEVMLDLCLQTGTQTRKLGLISPVSGGFGLDKRLSGPMDTGEGRFFLQPRRKVGKGCFCPVWEQEPFAYLQRLEAAFLAVQNGQLGLILPEEK